MSFGFSAKPTRLYSIFDPFVYPIVSKRPFFPPSSFECVFYKHFGRSWTGCDEGSTCCQTCYVLWTLWVQSKSHLLLQFIYVPFFFTFICHNLEPNKLFFNEGVEAKSRICGLYCEGQQLNSKLSNCLCSAFYHHITGKTQLMNTLTVHCFSYWNCSLFEINVEKMKNPLATLQKTKAKQSPLIRCHQLSDLTQSWWWYCISLTTVKKATNTSWLWKWVLWEDRGTGLGFGLHPRPGAWSSSSTSTCIGTNAGAEGLGAEPSPSLTQFSGVPDSRRLGVSG